MPTKMPLTRSFKEIVKERLARDPKFCAALTAEVRAVRDTKLKRTLRSYLRHPEVRAKRALKGSN